MSYRDLKINGKLAGRYDPERQLLELKVKGVKAVIDLTQIKAEVPRQPAPPKSGSESR